MLVKMSVHKESQRTYDWRILHKIKFKEMLHGESNGHMLDHILQPAAHTGHWWNGVGCTLRTVFPS